ncbi:G-protein coupled receptor 39 [Alosa sapidissima]|uniref:G-protein coupled receptor 39 n=1 Tax=Alosa sapidissima TaxID=34773 RepID=UPI001C0A35F0|nr:G-protein coupled receptor 39 [Alosa sapidissima]
MEIMDEEEKDWKVLEPSFSVKVFLTVLYSVILILGIIGNSVTIRTANVLRCKGYLQKNVTDHMVSLASSDLLVLLIGMPVELYSATWYPFMSASGDASCKIYNFLFETCSYATLLNVATMSFERFMAICYPFRYKSLSERRTGFLILFAWLTSVLVALPLLVATGMQGHIREKDGLPAQNLTFCTNLSEHWVMYKASISVAFVVYVVVLALVAFMCRSMIKVIKEAAGNVSKTESAQVKAARKQTIIFLGLIVLALVICWFPNQVRRLMTVARPKKAWTMDYLRSYATLHPVADTFFYLSSVVNPFLYNLSSKQFRATFLQVFLCRPTVEHVNRRALSTPWTPKSSMHPLVPKSRRQKNSSQDGRPKEEEPCNTQQNDSGVVVTSSACLSDQECIELHNGATHLGKSESEI